MVHVTGDPGFPAWTNSVDASLAAKLDTTVASSTYVLKVAAPNGTDDTTVIQAAHDSLPASGGMLQLQGGTYLIPNGGVVFTKPVVLRGVGSGSWRTATAPTVISCSSSTAVAITVATHGCKFADFMLKNTHALPTAGSGIYVTAGNMTRITDVVVTGFWINVDVIDGSEWFMSGTILHNAVKYGLQMAHVDSVDGGDIDITDCQFIAGTTRPTDAGLHWLSGGGLRMSNCKWNASATAFPFGNGIKLDVGNGVVTGQLMLSNCSIENWSIHALHVVVTAGGSFSGVMLSNVQTGSYVAGAQEAFKFEAGAGTLSSVFLSEISAQRLPFVANGDGYALVSCSGVAGVELHGLRMYGYNSGRVALTNCTYVSIDPILTGIDFNGAGNYTNAVASWGYAGGGAVDHYVPVNVGDILIVDLACTVLGAVGGALFHLGVELQGATNTQIEGAQFTETFAGTYQLIAKIRHRIVAADLRLDGNVVRVLPIFYKSAGTATILNSAGVIPTCQITAYSTTGI